MARKKMDEIPSLYFYIGKRIQQLRELKGMSQEELARSIGYFRTTIVNAEGGKQRIHIEALYRIASVLECKPGDLLPELSERVLMTKEQAFIQFLKGENENIREPETEG